MPTLITEWSSSLGTGDYPLSQSTTANKPEYITSSVDTDYAAMGGNTVKFDGSNDELSLFGFNDTLATLPISSSAVSILSFSGDSCTLRR